jgi:inosose dehydratase
VGTPSVYFNARLHEGDWRERADALVGAAVKAKEGMGEGVGGGMGVKVVVVNPEPVRWGSLEDKNDGQLRVQAGAMRYLVDELAKVGLTLAYHTHDPEMRQAAREFHHMMTTTADKPMRWCLDTHWIYRGAGNSNVALDSLIKLYGSRVVTAHVRQSVGGVWSEVFGAGDVVEMGWVKLLKELKPAGPILLEQAAEAGTPRTMEISERLRVGAEHLRQLLVT